MKRECASTGACGACTESVCSPTPAPTAGQEGFRFVPLNFATNRSYFTAGHYGCRIAWIDAQSAPASSFRVGDDEYSWQKQGSLDVWKGGKAGSAQTSSWVQYSYSNLSLPFGPATVSVGNHTYNLLVPRWGDDAESDVLFFGDINVNEDGRYGLQEAARVMQTVVGRNSATAAACFPGDIFYQDRWQDFVDKWKLLSETGGKKITEYMVFGVQGNHDYDIEGARPVSGAWVPVFFASDGLSSFDEGLQGYRQGTAVPLQNSIGVFVVGRTCFILADNYYRGDEIAGAYDWRSFDAALGSSVDCVLVTTHWNGVNLGAVSDTDQVLQALERFFPSRRVRGNTNHVHCNGMQSSNTKQTGGNGYKGDCAAIQPSCIGNAACCPSLYSRGTFAETGYGPGQVCAGIAERLAQDSPAVGSHEPALQRRLLAAFDSKAHLNGHLLTPEETIRYYPPGLLNDDFIHEGRAVMAPLLRADLRSLGEKLPEDQREGFEAAYAQRYRIRDGYPHCSTLSPAMPGKPGFDCWEDGASPLRRLAGARGLALSDVVGASEPGQGSSH